MQSYLHQLNILNRNISTVRTLSRQSCFLWDTYAGEAMHSVAKLVAWKWSKWASRAKNFSRENSAECRMHREKKNPLHTPWVRSINLLRERSGSRALSRRITFDVRISNAKRENSSREDQRRSFRIEKTLCFDTHFPSFSSPLCACPACETIEKKIARRGTIELSLRRYDSIVNTYIHGEKKPASRQSADGQISSTARYNAPLFIGHFVSRSFFLRGSARGLVETGSDICRVAWERRCLAPTR